MSRATASNYLNPNLRRRSRSGVFDSSPSSSSPGDSGTPANSSAAGPRDGAGRPGATVDRQHLHRPVYASGGSGTDGDHAAGVSATAAAAGVAGRPRRMTQQAAKLTIDAARAQAAGANASKRVPATAIGVGSHVQMQAQAKPHVGQARGVHGGSGGGAGSTTGRRFLRTPSNPDLRLSSSGRQTDSSDKEPAATPGRKPSLALKQFATDSASAGNASPSVATGYSGGHRPLQAKLETSSNAMHSDSERSSGPTEMRQRTRTIPVSAGRAGRSVVGTAGAKPLTWRTQQQQQQAARGGESKSVVGSGSSQRAPGAYAGVPGTKLAIRETSATSASRGKSGAGATSSGEDANEDCDPKMQAPRLRPTQSKPLHLGGSAAAPHLRSQNNISSSASAIGIGSYNSTHQAPRGAPRAGAAASVVGAVPPPVPLQTHPLVGQGARPQIASYQQRYPAQKGPSSVVSAAPAPTQQMMHIHFPASKTGDQQSVATAQQRHPQQPMAQQQQQIQSRPQSGAHSSAQTPDAKSAGGVPALTPQEAIARYGQQLSAQERTEILEFPHVYYVGNAKARSGTRPNYGFDDERGDYIVNLHDHMLYRYELMEVLGKGSFGQVLRARDHKTGDIVAIKIIRNRKRFHHQAQVEVKLLECLRRWDPTGAHNILQMTASFYFRNHLCIVMELLSINLYEWLKAHQFAGTPAPLLRNLTIQMLQSLQLMARHRIIHADLKPENILLASPPPMPSRRAAPPGAAGPPPHPLNNPQLGLDIQRGAYAIKVIDLGSSCFETERVYTYIQSRFYRAPEVILGLPYGTGIDMWSLGCIAAELLTGYPLFPGENEREQLSCIVEVLGPPPAYMLERAPRCADFAEPAPYAVTPIPTGNMMLLPNGSCVVGSVVIKPYTNSKGKRRRPGSRPLAQVLARARDPRLVDFVMRTLAWDPAMRMSPEDALRHPWITDMPMQRQQHGVVAPPHAHLGAPQPGYVMMPAGYSQQQQQQQQQHMAHGAGHPHPPNAAAAAAASGGYIQQMAHQQHQQQHQQQAAYGNLARTRKA
ncbi:kinase-like protein [Martensiomyces pterosporus]|nr:kinase-like protein [Martensiomyces pterosporus]